MKMHWQIAIALVLAAATGALLSQDSSWITVCDYIGRLFLSALKMLVVPLIVSAIISGLIGIGGDDSGQLGRLGYKTAFYYLATTTLAVVTGLAFGNLLTPGIINGQPAGERLGLEASTEQVIGQVEGQGMGDVAGIFLRMFPPNIFAAAAADQMLGLIVFSLLIGFFIRRLPESLYAAQRGFWDGLYQVMIGITGLVIRFAPLGVYGLVTAVVARTGWGAFTPLLIFFIAVTGALALHMFVTLPVLLRFVGGVSPMAHFQAMAPALMTAFSTSSSSATLPLTIECVEKRAGVSKPVTSFVLPLGATVNMDGTALYECVAALFIAQAYGLDLSVSQQFIVVVMALVTSIGVAGIPSASLVAIAVILGAVGLPLEGVGLILAVDRILDMCRTAVNVFSDSCGAVIIGRSEGETGILAVDPDLAQQAKN